MTYRAFVPMTTSPSSAMICLWAPVFMSTHGCARTLPSPLRQNLLDHLHRCAPFYQHVETQGGSNPTFEVSQHVADTDDAAVLREYLGDAPARVLGAAAYRFLNEQCTSRKRVYELQLKVSSGDVGAAREGWGAYDDQAVAHD